MLQPRFAYWVFQTIAATMVATWILHPLLSEGRALTFQSLVTVSTPGIKGRKPKENLGSVVSLQQQQNMIGFLHCLV